MEDRSRRQWLAAIGAASVPGMAGCVGNLNGTGSDGDGDGESSDGDTGDGGMGNESDDPDSTADQMDGDGVDLTATDPVVPPAFSLELSEYDTEAGTAVVGYDGERMTAEHAGRIANCDSPGLGVLVSGEYRGCFTTPIEPGNTVTVDAALRAQIQVVWVPPGGSVPIQIYDVKAEGQLMVPQIAFGFDWNADAQRLRIVHEGGDPINGNNTDTLRVTSDSVDRTWFDGDGSISAGISIDVEGDLSGETVQVVWTSPSGGTSQVLATFTVP